jgi:hypothetical protein
MSYLSELARTSVGATTGFVAFPATEMSPFAAASHQHYMVSLA